MVLPGSLSLTLSFLILAFFVGEVDLIASLCLFSSQSLKLIFGFFFFFGGVVVLSGDISSAFLGDVWFLLALPFQTFRTGLNGNSSWSCFLGCFNVSSRLAVRVLGLWRGQGA